VRVSFFSTFFASVNAEQVMLRMHEQRHFGVDVNFTLFCSILIKAGVYQQMVKFP
jgi:uncharacterized protein YbcV (DUF1398 family)